MKVLLLAMSLTSSAVFGQAISIDQYERLVVAIKTGGCKATPEVAEAEVRQLRPGAWALYGMAALEYLQRHKHPNLSTFDMAMHYCIKPPRPLGRVDQWRYESCQQDAAKAPTPQGVNIGMRLCREKFDQQ